MAQRRDLFYHLDRLPESAVCEILGHLDVRDCARLAQTCRAAPPATETVTALNFLPEGTEFGPPGFGMDVAAVLRRRAELIGRCRRLQTLIASDKSFKDGGAWPAALSLLRSARLPSLRRVEVLNHVGPQLFGDLDAAMRTQGPDCRLHLTVCSSEALAALAARPSPMTGLERLDVQVYGPDPVSPGEDGGAADEANIAAVAAGMRPACRLSQQRKGGADGGGAGGGGAEFGVSLWAYAVGEEEFITVGRALAITDSLALQGAPARLVSLDPLVVSSAEETLSAGERLVAPLTKLVVRFSSFSDGKPVPLAALLRGATSLRHLEIDGNKYGWDLAAGGHISGCGGGAAAAHTATAFAALGGLTTLKLSDVGECHLDALIHDRRNPRSAYLELDLGLPPLHIAPIVEGGRLWRCLEELTFHCRSLAASGDLAVLGRLTRLRRLDLQILASPLSLGPLGPHGVSGSGSTCGACSIPRRRQRQGDASNAHHRVWRGQDAHLTWLQCLTSLQDLRLHAPLLDFDWLPPSLTRLDANGTCGFGSVTVCRAPAPGQPPGGSLPHLKRLVLGTSAEMMGRRRMRGLARWDAQYEKRSSLRSNGGEDGEGGACCCCWNHLLWRERQRAQLEGPTYRRHRLCGGSEQVQWEAIAERFAGDEALLHAIALRCPGLEEIDCKGWVVSCAAAGAVAHALRRTLQSFSLCDADDLGGARHSLAVKRAAPSVEVRAVNRF